MTARIGRIAQAAGVSVHTLRYYERLGLLLAPPRTPAGYRVYDPTTLDRLRFIQQAQALGFSLAEVKEILRLKFSGQSPCDCVRRRLRARLEEIVKELRHLRAVRREIRACLERSRRLPRLPHSASNICPIIENRQHRRDLSAKTTKGGAR